MIIIRNANAAKAPVIMEMKAGVNCILRSAWDTGFPPLILRNPHVTIIKISVAQTILAIRSIFPIVFVIYYKITNFRDYMGFNVKNIINFYISGFRSMTTGKYLWIIILIKLFIMFAILKVFFFKGELSQYDTQEEKSRHVIEQLIDKVPEND